MDEDRVLIAVSRDGRLRARAARTTALVREALRRHQAGPLGAESLARALTSTATFPATWKDCERVSIQWSGAGPLKTIFTEIRVGGAIRGYVRAPRAGNRCDLDGYRGVGHGLLPGGFVGVIRQDMRGRFTQSQVDLVNGEIDEDLERFFEISDQVATRVRALWSPGADGPTATAAVLVQALPGDMPAVLPTGDALLALDPEAPLDTMLTAALGEGFDVLDEVQLTFACPCERGRLEAGLELLDVDDLLDMINKDSGASVRCDFCGEDYEFDREDLEAIMVKKVTDKGDEA